MRYHFFTVLIITVIALGTRLLFLPMVPFHLSDDEVLRAVTVNSVLKTGRDLDGNLLPLFWQRGGMVTLPFHGVVSGLSILVFGMNPLGVRLPTAFIGALTPLLLYVLAFRLSRRRLIAASAAFLLAVSPWHMYLSRFENAAPLLVFLLTFGVERVIAAKDRFPRLALFSFAAAMLTDMAAWIFVPAMMVLLGRRGWRQRTFIFSLIGVALFVADFNLLQIGIQRSLFVNFALNNVPAILGMFLDRLFAILSFTFFFFRGDEGLHHALADIGILYLSTLPLLFIGGYRLVTHGQKAQHLLFSIFILTSGVTALSRFAPDARLFLFAAIPLHFMLGIAVAALWDWSVESLTRRLVPIGLSVVLLYNIVLAAHLYFGHYGRESAEVSQASFPSMWQFVKQHMETYDRVIISGRTHANLSAHGLFHLNINPAHFQANGSSAAFDHFVFGDLSLEHFPERRILLIAETDYDPGVGDEVAVFTLANGTSEFIAWDIQR